MTIFKDRLASAIRIKRRFAPSRERVVEVRSKTVAVIVLLLATAVLLVILDWLRT